MFPSHCFIFGLILIWVPGYPQQPWKSLWQSRYRPNLDLPLSSNPHIGFKKPGRDERGFRVFRSIYFDLQRLPPASQIKVIILHKLMWISDFTWKEITCWLETHTNSDLLIHCIWLHTFSCIPLNLCGIVSHTSSLEHFLFRGSMNQCFNRQHWFTCLLSVNSDKRWSFPLWLAGVPHCRLFKCVFWFRGILECMNFYAWQQFGRSFARSWSLNVSLRNVKAPYMKKQTV